MGSISNYGARMLEDRNGNMATELQNLSSERCNIALHELKDKQTVDDEKSLFRSTSYLSEGDYGTAYGTVWMQIQKAKTESEGLYEFMFRTFSEIWTTSEFHCVCVVIVPSLFTAAILLLLLGLPVSMIVVGSSYRGECPKEPKIPIYLLVGGAFGFIKVLLLLWRHRKTRDYERIDDDEDDDLDDPVMSRSTEFTNFILNVFLLSWFILGNFWIFHVWEPNFQQPLHEPSNWCNEICYKYAVYQLVACYGIIFIAFVVVLCFLSYYCCGRFRENSC